MIPQDLARSTPSATRETKMEREAQERRRRRKHRCGSALATRMKRRAGLALLLCSLGLGCGRSPIGPFSADMRSEGAFDPWVDGCSKVDYLFIVDNSSSMANNQHKLALSVTDFVRGVAGVLESVDSVHVGVMTTDAYEYNAPGCEQLGALVTQTGGYNSLGETCGPFAQGHRFMTEQDDLEAGLECTIQVGTTGSTSERPLGALRAALEPRSEDVAVCNEGFLRSDAMLVVVILTDEDGVNDTLSYDALVRAKGGNSEAVVVLSIAHTEDDTCSRTGHARQADVLMRFTRRFEHGLIESICASSFEGPFQRATELIRGACGE